MRPDPSDAPPLLARSPPPGVCPCRRELDAALRAVGLTSQHSHELRDHKPQIKAFIKASRARGVLGCQGEHARGAVGRCEVGGERRGGSCASYGHAAGPPWPDGVPRSWLDPRSSALPFICSQRNRGSVAGILELYEQQRQAAEAAAALRAADYKARLKRREKLMGR